MEGEPAAAPQWADGLTASTGSTGSTGSGGSSPGISNPPPSGVLSGLLLSRVSAFYLAAGAVMLVIAMLLLSALGWWYFSQLASGMLTLRFVVALLLGQLMLLIGSVLVALLLWRRSQVVLALRKGERMASRVMVVLLRSSGEAGALMVLFFALALGLPVMIAPDSLVALAPLPAETSAWLASYPPLLQWIGFGLLGLAIIAAGASLAAMLLLMAGFLAEGLALMLQVADDTRRVREQLASFKGSDEVLRAFR